MKLYTESELARCNYCIGVDSMGNEFECEDCANKIAQLKVMMDKQEAMDNLVHSSNVSLMNSADDDAMPMYPCQECGGLTDASDFVCCDCRHSLAADNPLSYESISF